MPTDEGGGNFVSATDLENLHGEFPGFREPVALGAAAWSRRPPPQCSFREVDDLPLWG
ncbi:hypothetical protein FRAAL0478 [Frankia alni ACN14a]|uniref:Uncharacterized protein n=1 Tax=Frankia alni (strain DSM 45986 / CECT 9034 / ACN14a) TaxID=326424 RepID=Q0RTE6_FRAAA|nr:hypothetical protein FRAAL0478 [Frankia alni ACN14a]